MKALLVIAHGSKRQNSNQEVCDFIEALKLGMCGEYPIVESAFLEFAAPSIPAAIERCIVSGATQLFILPYFLSAGKHVRTDIPEEVASALTNVAGVEINMLPHIGSSLKMLDLVRDMAVAS